MNETQQNLRERAAVAWLKAKRDMKFADSERDAFEVGFLQGMGAGHDAAFNSTTKAIREMLAK